MNGSTNKIVLVLGGAECVWTDAKAALKLFDPDITIAVNDIGIVWPYDIDHWVSYHPNYLRLSVKKRKAIGLPPAKELWSIPRNPRGTQYPEFKTMECTGGSSGFMGMTLGVRFGSKVVLAGIPMNPEMRHFNDKQKGKPWVDGKNYIEHWEQSVPAHRHIVRSMSGVTKELFGEPTVDWLRT